MAEVGDAVATEDRDFTQSDFVRAQCGLDDRKVGAIRHAVVLSRDGAMFGLGSPWKGQPGLRRLTPTFDRPFAGKRSDVNEGTAQRSPKALGPQIRRGRPQGPSDVRDLASSRQKDLQLIRLNAPDLTLVGMDREKGRTYELPPQLGQIGALALEGHPCNPEARGFPRRPVKRGLLDRAHEDRLRPRGGRRSKTLLNLLNLFAGVVLSVVLVKDEPIAQSGSPAVRSYQVLVLVAGSPEEER